MTKNLFRDLAVVGVLTIAFFGGLGEYMKYKHVTRERVASVAWVVPYQTACITHEPTQVSLWEANFGPPTHRVVTIDGSTLRFRGRAPSGDNGCGGNENAVELDLYRSNNT